MKKMANFSQIFSQLMQAKKTTQQLLGKMTNITNAQSNSLQKQNQSLDQQIIQAQNELKKVQGQADIVNNLQTNAQSSGIVINKNSPQVQTQIKQTNNTLPLNSSTGAWHPRSNTYKGKQFNGYYEGNDNPEFIVDIEHEPKESNTQTKDGVSEYWTNRDLAIKVARELNAQGIRCGILERVIGAKVIDTAFVNENFKGANLVELHNNDSPSASTNGVLALKSAQQGDNALGMSMINNLVSTAGFKKVASGLQDVSNGKGQRFVSGLPNLNNSLVELGFLSNDGDVQKIRQNNGYNVVLALTNGFLESTGKPKITELKSMQKTNQMTSYNKQILNINVGTSNVAVAQSNIQQPVDGNSNISIDNSSNNTNTSTNTTSNKKNLSQMVSKAKKNKKNKKNKIIASNKSKVKTKKA
jgi:hypothetical protein